MDEEEKIFQLGLSLFPRIGFKLWKELITKFDTATNIFKNPSLLKNIKNCTEIYKGILEKQFVNEAEKIFLDHQKKDIKIISFFDEGYPYRLKQITNPPCFLYKTGNLNLNDKSFLSIVGTRSASEYGKSIVKNIVKDLSTYDVVITSGMAYGIDVNAHMAALANNIPTLAIIAGGLDKIYPQTHQPICKKIVKDGGSIITESQLGTTPENFLFPARNRIIAGCSDAVLVVEAGEKSGATITAVCANDFNREVFAIPGNVNSPTSIGCNNLIKNNSAHLVTCVDDIVNFMNLKKKENFVQKKNDVKISVKLDDLSEKVFDAIKENDNISFDEIFYKTEIEYTKLSTILINLELKNLIQLTPGDRYKVV